MTDREYIDRSTGAHQRLDILRKQVEGHMAKAHSEVSIDAVAGLISRMSEICDELAALDREYQANA